MTIPSPSLLLRRPCRIQAVSLLADVPPRNSTRTLRLRSFAQRARRLVARCLLLCAALAFGRLALAQEPPAPPAVVPAQAQAGPQPTPANPFGRVYPARVYGTVRLQGPPPTIDGRLDDEAWKEGEWSGNFTQQIPTEGAPPSQKTEVKILYDERHVYAAIRAYDDPALIHRYAARRDTFVGDIVGVCFDSYNDKRTGFEFDLMAGGSKIDLVLGNGETEWDTTWDAVWDGKVAMEKDAWTAEFRIPLSQLRYSSETDQVWGLHVWRWNDRQQEEDQWQLIPRQNSGRMYNLGELRGIHGLKRFRRVELLPHTLGKIVSEPEVPGDPYRNGPDPFGSLGLDAKVGLSSNFTLDATINPDFGQVEADPSVMNLSAFETFYEEKRPFFLEGKKILTFDLTGEGSGGDSLFYTRRVGAAPGSAPDVAEGEYVKVPETTSILDALKVTGKTSDGLSVGVLQSFTAEETARISSGGVERREVVEPYSNFFVGRAQKDWDKGNTILGGMLTSTHRFISDANLAALPVDAVTGGVDFVRYFANRSFSLETRLVGSHVTGEAEAIHALATNPVHYFQRPDATHLSLDEGATSLSGQGGFFRLGTTEKSRWRASGAVRWISPGLELNDLGYLRQADLTESQIEVGYDDPRPHGILRRFGGHAEREDAWDFSGLHVESTTSIHLDATFTNKWNASAALHVTGEPIDTRLLRGGPAMKLSQGSFASIYAQTDPSRKVSASVNLFEHRYDEKPSRQREISTGLDLRLTNALSVSANVGYARNTDDLQYVATPQADGSQRYVLGRIEQETLSTTLRVNFNLTPDLSIQFYGSPFVSTGRYTDFKRATDTQAPQYSDRFHAFGPEEITYQPGSNSYDVVEEGDGAYSFGNPDFSFRQFRSNLVGRWEFKPGSSLYVVWSQGRTGFVDEWQESLGDNLDALRSTPSTNVFLVKFSYWFSL